MLCELKNIEIIGIKKEKDPENIKELLEKIKEEEKTQLGIIEILQIFEKLPQNQLFQQLLPLFEEILKIKKQKLEKLKQQ